MNINEAIPPSDHSGHLNSIRQAMAKTRPILFVLKAIHHVDILGHMCGGMCYEAFLEHTKT